MSRKIFVNLPVKNLPVSMDFFRGLGFTFNKQFTNDDAACMVITDDIYAMLLMRPFFQGFLPASKSIADSTSTAEVLVCLSCDSRSEVDELTQKAISLGAREPRPTQDIGFMYSRAFEDPDGHIWELFWMDPAAVEQ